MFRAGLHTLWDAHNNTHRKLSQPDEEGSGMQHNQSHQDVRTMKMEEHTRIDVGMWLKVTFFHLIADVQVIRHILAI